MARVILLSKCIWLLLFIFFNWYLFIYFCVYFHHFPSSLWGWTQLGVEMNNHVYRTVTATMTLLCGRPAHLHGQLSSLPELFLPQGVYSWRRRHEHGFRFWDFVGCVCSFTCSGLGFILSGFMSLKLCSYHLWIMYMNIVTFIILPLYTYHLETWCEYKQGRKTGKTDGKESEDRGGGRERRGCAALASVVLHVTPASLQRSVPIGTGVFHFSIGYLSLCYICWLLYMFSVCWGDTKKSYIFNTSKRAINVINNLLNNV